MNVIIVVATFLLAFFSGSTARAQVSADFYLGGVIVIGESTSTCDSSTAGALRYNADDKVLELCHDGEWTPLD